MAGQAKERGLPPQLPIMAGLVESGLKNLNFGDADSVGFFQMRVGIWNQGAYAGYPDKPELQMKWFLDQAEAVKRQRLVAGKPIDDPNSFGEWIADVERPAEQYRGRYQHQARGGQRPAAVRAPAAARRRRAGAAAAAADPAAAAASVAAVGNAKLPAEIAGPVQEAIASGHPPGAKALAAIEEASKYLGTDYKWGGSTPQTGFDCSGLMQWAYAQSGVQIPRVTYTQIEAPNGTEIADRADLAPGDLVFFSNAGDVHHVGMYLGGDKFLHAPRTGDVVKVSSLSEPYYAQQFAGGRRFDASAPGRRRAAPPRRRGRRRAAAPRRRSTRPRSPRPRPRSRATPPRCAAHDSQLFMAVKAEEATKQREYTALADVPAGRRPVAGQAPLAGGTGRRRARAPAARGAGARRRRRPRPRRRAAPVAPAARPRPPPAPPPRPSRHVSVDLSDAATDYPGDNAGQEALAKWLAKQAEKAGLPPELPVMAALVESGVKNLNFGDADSVGFFQMRVGIWNQGAYAGYPGQAGAAGQVVHRPGARAQAQADRRGRRRLRQGPGEVGRVDRRRRAPRRAVPRPLPAAPRRGAQAAHLAGRHRKRPPVTGGRWRSAAGVLALAAAGDAALAAAAAAAAVAAAAATAGRAAAGLPLLRCSRSAGRSAAAAVLHRSCCPWCRRRSAAAVGLPPVAAACAAVGRWLGLRLRVLLERRQARERRRRPDERGRAARSRPWPGPSSASFMSPRRASAAEPWRL